MLLVFAFQINVLNFPSRPLVFFIWLVEHWEMSFSFCSDHFPGFAINVGTCSTGLNLLWSKGAQRVVIDCDNKQVHVRH